MFQHRTNEEYPGSIIDVSQLQYMLEKAGGYGYKNVGFILDRGYFSKENIHYMDKCDYEFVIMMKGMKDLVKSLVLEVKGSFEKDRRYSIRNHKERSCSGEINHILGTKAFEYIQVSRYMQRYLVCGSDHPKQDLCMP